MVFVRIKFQGYTGLQPLKGIGEGRKFEGGGIDGAYAAVKHAVGASPVHVVLVEFDPFLVFGLIAHHLADRVCNLAGPVPGRPLPVSIVGPARTRS